MTAGIYASRYGLHTAIVEQMMAGAQIINLEKIENFPGFPQGIAGYELGPATQEQAMNVGVEVLMDTATDVSVDGDYLRVYGRHGRQLSRQGRNHGGGFLPPFPGHPR